MSTQKANEAGALVAAYAGGDVARASVSLLEQMEAREMEELVQASPADVTAIQARVKLLRGLTKVFRGESTSPY